MPQNLPTAKGLIAAMARVTDKKCLIILWRLIKTQEENTKCPQHKPDSYRAEECDNKNTAFSPQIIRGIE